MLMDFYMKFYVNLKIFYGECKNYCKISYFFGVMLNVEGYWFVDEGKDFCNYIYV